MSLLSSRSVIYEFMDFLPFLDDRSQLAEMVSEGVIKNVAIGERINNSEMKLMSMRYWHTLVFLKASGLKA